MKDFDLDKARLDPTAVFPSPEAVVEHPRLAREQKIDILERWEYDARQFEVAEAENLGGGEPSMLERVLQALAALGAVADRERRSTTRRGAI